MSAGLLIIAVLALGTAFFDYRDGRIRTSAYFAASASVLAILAIMLKLGWTL